MKRVLLKPRLLIALSVLMLATVACTKQDLQTPATQDAVSTDDETLRPGESIEADVSPGVYKIQRFTDTGDDETAQFNGYTFDFQADGTLVATTNTGAVHTGRWSLNSAETRMTLVIRGTNALQDLDDDDWKVQRITNQRIKIKAQGPDVAIFVKL